MNAFSVLKYTIRILLGVFIGTYLTILALLNIPSVQEKLSVVVSQELKSLLRTEVSVGKIDLGLLNRIIIEDVRLQDREERELLKVARLSAKFEWAPLLNGKITISSVQLFGFTAQLHRDTPESAPNFQFVLNTFASQDTIKQGTNLDLRINSVLIRRGRIKYDVASLPTTPGQFNPNHLSIQNLAATLSLKALRKDTLNAAIRRFSFDEESGFSLRKLALKVTANHRRMHIHDFGIELSHTHLRMDSLVLHYDSLPHLPQFTEQSTFQGELQATVGLQDLAPFVPSLARFKTPLDLRLVLSGQGKNLNCTTLSLKGPDGIRLNGEASLERWDAGMDMFILAKLKQLQLTREGINTLMNNLTGKVPPILERLGAIHLQGEAAGYLHDLTLTGQLQTGVGTVKTDVMMSIHPANKQRSYSGNILSKDLNLGQLLNNPQKFGLVDFNLDLQGFTYQDQYPESHIKGRISSLDYSQYTYHNILLDGLYKNGGFNGRLSLDDVNGSVQIDGSFNIAQAVPEFNLQASIKNLRPYELHLSELHPHSDLSLRLTADFTGHSIDDINGFISLDSLRLTTPRLSDNYFLENLTLTAGQVNGQKEVQLQSSFLSATVRGDYSYSTIPASILKTVQRYIPSLLTLKKNLPDPHNNFQFDICLNNAEPFAKLLHIPLELQFPATLKGYFNDRDQQLKVEGYFPSFSYNGTAYESGVLLCENPTDQFNCSLRSSMLMNSGAMLNFSVNADAQNDQLKTTLNWGNNTDVTYGGQFAALTRFHKTEGKKPILQADIDILPTQVVLNDTIWNIHPSHIAIDSGRVFIDKFLFEHADQYLCIDGRLTKEATDSCLVDLQNIQVEYVMDIVQFDDVLFGGLASGQVHLKRVLKNPIMQTRLNVHRFTLNHSLLGEADIRGVWDDELGGIRLDAQIAEEGLSNTHVTGYVSPKLKGLDLLIEADRTHVGFLQPFIEGIFSDIDGRVNGHVRLFGEFKYLDLEGEVLANMNAKVDVLNTEFQLKNDSVHLTSGILDFRNVKIYDREGHEGIVNGYLHHNKLKDLMYQFNIRGNNLLMYNTREPNGMPFYGKVYGTGTVLLSGGNNAMNVDASLTTGNHTTFTYISGMTTEAASNQFITFVDKTPKRVGEQVHTELYHHANAQKKKEEDGPEMDLRINMFIDATPNATMKVIMDPVAGDHITATGRGNLQVDYFNKGDFRMFGSYVIDQGVYKLSMQEVIRKDFTLKSGGTVTFAGDPYQANLDLQAVYTVNSASLSDLVADPSRNQATVKVNCLMNLTGALSNPDFKFDLELPTVREEDRELVRSATSTEEQMNTQIIYLLGIGKFYTYDYTQNDQSSNATSSLAFSTLSGQLNNMLSQWMANKNWNIGANLSTGEKGWTDVEAEAMLSGRLLNNRLLLNGNFGYKENVLANTNFVGDFEAIWLLTKNGDFRLRGYNQTNDRYFTKSTLTTQGIGLMYKKDFNSWKELFSWFPQKRKPKKKGQTETGDRQPQTQQPAPEGNPEEGASPTEPQPALAGEKREKGNQTGKEPKATLLPAERKVIPASGEEKSIGNDSTQTAQEKSEDLDWLIFR